MGLDSVFDLDVRCPDSAWAVANLEEMAWHGGIPRSDMSALQLLPLDPLSLYPSIDVSLRLFCISVICILP